MEVRNLSEIAAGEDLLHPTIPHVLLEGIDDLEDPILFLNRLRTRTPQARVFALVSNAAHLISLGSFYAGKRLAQGHPLVLEEIGPLFLAAGWQPLAITALLDESLPPAEALPVTVTAGEIGFQLVDPTVLMRGRSAAFLVVADPQ